jgi:hypothetical protein
MTPVSSRWTTDVGSSDHALLAISCLHCSWSWRGTVPSLASLLMDSLPFQNLSHYQTASACDLLGPFEVIKTHTSALKKLSETLRQGWLVRLLICALRSLSEWLPTILQLGPASSQVAGMTPLDPMTRSPRSEQSDLQRVVNHADIMHSPDVIAALKRHGLIDGAIRAPQPGAPFAYVTTRNFLGSVRVRLRPRPARPLAAESRTPAYERAGEGRTQQRARAGG